MKYLETNYSILKITPNCFDDESKIDELILSGKLTNMVYRSYKGDDAPFYEMRTENNIFHVHTEKYLRQLFYDLNIDATIK